MADKLERLLNLTAILLETTIPLSAEDLRQKVEGYPPPGAAFRRTFERDKDDLRNLGIPLVVARVPGTDPPIDGYRIRPEDYYLADPGLDGEELAAMHLATMVIKLTSDDDRSALWKLGGIPEDDRAEVDALASIPIDPSLGVLFAAISDQTAVAFTYGSDAPETRRLEPWRLEFQRGRWYVSGYDRDRSAERNFRLDRMGDDVRRLDGPEAAFTNDVNPRARERPLPGWLLGGSEPIEVMLDVDTALVPHVRNELGTTVAEESVPGGTRFTVSVSNWPSFRSFVLSLLDGAEVVGPPEQRQDMIQWLEALQTQ